MADLFLLLFATIGGFLVLGCLRAVAQEYARAVRWHDLKVQVSNLRLEQKRQLEALAAAEADAQTAPPPARAA